MNIPRIKAQTIFAFMFYATFLKLVWYGGTVPPELAQMVNTIMVFYFGYKAGKKKSDENQL